MNSCRVRRSKEPPGKESDRVLMERMEPVRNALVSRRKEEFEEITLRIS
jgi:hypothetical protein